MSLAKSFSGQLIGLKLDIVSIEVDISNGLHSFSIIGLGDRAVDEAKDRISAAIKNTGFTSPKQKNQKVVISLAPADVRKEGPSFDLGMALAYLKASGDISFDPSDKLFFGELSLEGNIRKISGILPILCQASGHGFGEIFIPEDNLEEASLAKGLNIYPATTLREVIEHLCEIKLIAKAVFEPDLSTHTTSALMNMNSVSGNEATKRGLEIAAAGAHNLIMCGPPGTGKTMLAQCFSSILPDLSYKQAVEVTSIHSIAKTLERGLVFRPPFRSPHHTASYPSIIGGGAFPKPGEITLAHRGVLFLDEFPEFSRDVIEALRQPLEDRSITISRARGVITFPAQCILIASMNPCPCGKGKNNGCICSVRELENYNRKISGPIIDRIDIWLNVNKVDYKRLSTKDSVAENSESIKKRVVKARAVQLERFSFHKIDKLFNSELSADDINKIIKIDDPARSALAISAEKLELSGRAFHRVIKVAQTIADLEESAIVNKKHILEALQYRRNRGI